LLPATPSPSSSAPVPRGIAAALIVAGAGAVAFGLLADSIGLGGAPGIGTRQIAIALFGVALAAIGAAVWTPSDRGLRGWLRRKWELAPSITAWQCVRLGAWFGVMLGIAEVIHSGIRKYGSGIILKQPEHLVWMAPLSYLVLFAAIGALFALVVRVRARVITLPIAVFVLAALAMWSQMLLYPWLDGRAVAVLAIGLGVQIARTVARRPRGFTALVRRTWWPAVALVIAAGVGVTATTYWIERRTVADLPAAPPDAPNVLLVVLDTVRADHLPTNGYHRDTSPHIAKLAAQGVVFDWAISTSPWTLPSHATMFTGRYHHETKADWLTPLDDAYPTLAEILSSRGYVTGGFVGNLMYCLRENGLGRGFSHYEDFQIKFGTLLLSTSIGRFAASSVLGNEIRPLASNSAETVTDRFLEWLPRADGRPFFAFLNYIDAHALYLPPPGFETRFGPRSPYLTKWYDQPTWPPDVMQGFIDAYDACIAYIDSQFARITSHLDAQGLLDDTVIIVVGDHGEQFGEHGLTDHGNSLYAQLLHVPLIVSFPPRVPAAQNVAELVSLRDLAATILDLTGLPADPLPGTSLARFWGGSAPEGDATLLLSEVSRGIHTPEHEPRTAGDMKSIIEDGLHLIRNGDGSTELYDLRADPAEEHDLTDTEAGRARARPLRDKLLLVPPKPGSPEN
jgi:arylsulfatase A-like enzyme